MISLPIFVSISDINRGKILFLQRETGNREAITLLLSLLDMPQTHLDYFNAPIPNGHLLPPWVSEAIILDRLEKIIDEHNRGGDLDSQCTFSEVMAILYATTRQLAMPLQADHTLYLLWSSAITLEKHRGVVPDISDLPDVESPFFREELTRIRRWAFRGIMAAGKKKKIEISGLHPNILRIGCQCQR